MKVAVIDFGLWLAMSMSLITAGAFAAGGYMLIGIAFIVAGGILDTVRVMRFRRHGMRQ